MSNDVRIMKKVKEIVRTMLYSEATVTVFILQSFNAMDLDVGLHEYQVLYCGSSICDRIWRCCIIISIAGERDRGSCYSIKSGVNISCSQQASTVIFIPVD